jgi:hypothetical protein
LANMEAASAAASGVARSAVRLRQEKSRFELERMSWTALAVTSDDDLEAEHNAFWDDDASTK